VHLVLAAARRAPFPDGALDVVVTPWFIDAVAADILEVASAVNRVLRPGGLWINVGPLCYSGSASKAYSFDEICDFVRGSAFDLQSCEQHSLAYFDSPVSGTCRTDRTYVFAARKIGEPPVSVTPPKSTPWLDDLTQPIPLSAVMTESLQRSVMTAGIASLVDGTRSANDIATILSQSWNVEPRALILPIRAFLRSVVAA
jgi:hypothetical protein